MSGFRLRGCSRLGNFADDRSGAVAIIFALMAICLCLFVGAGVDIGRWLHARQQTISAMDAAVLAGGRALQLNPNDTSGAIAAAQKFYTENTKGRLPLLSDTITFQTTDNNTAFTATGNGYIATPLLGFVNIPKLPLLATSGAEYSKADLAVGGSSDGSVEIALMADVTGSMGGQKLTDLKAAATDLVEIVIPDTASQYSAKLALIPFSEEVRLPSSANAGARGSPPSTKDVCSGGGWGGWGGGGWGGSCTYDRTACVVERSGANKYTDAAPSSGNYVMTRYNSSGKCALGASGELVPLSSDKAALKTKISNLTASGGTAGQIGTAWAWYTLSPNWNSIWASSSSGAAAYGTANLQKIAILMTDGEYNTQYDANGVSTSDSNGGSAANGTATNQARSLCTGMKDKGITVYTVGFDLGGNQTAIDTLSQCATDPSKFYNADDGEQLKQAFRDIALKISQLYLTQ